MSLRCPQCGVALSVNLAVDTNFSRTKEILAQKASGAADITNEQLNALKWKQSQKKPALSTILVTQEILGVPLLKLLHDRLKSSASKSWKLGEITYKLSQNDEGTEWIQRWTPVGK